MRGDTIYIYTILVNEPEGKRPSVRCRRRWEVNINNKANLTEIGREGVD
jgi:hypothetical protein